jgi:hypothetical protein
MTKTVKQIVDEYLAKQNEPKYESVRIIEVNGANSVETKIYCNVSNIKFQNGGDISWYGVCMMPITFTHTDCSGNQCNEYIIGKIIKISNHTEA